MSRRATDVIGPTWKILIIAGQAELRTRLRGWLEQGSGRQCELAESEDGAAGMRWQAVGGGVPDCVLLAHEPPGQDALQVLTALRAGHPVPLCPVIVLLGAATEGRETESAALRAGAMECVPWRSLDGPALRRAVESAIDRFTPWRAAHRFMQGTSSGSESTRAQLEAVIDAMADGVVVFDMAGKVVLLNEAEARINGFASAAEMKRDLAFFGQIYELFSDDGRLLSVEEWPVSRVLRGENLVHVQLRARRRDTGQQWHIHFSGAPVLDEAGRQVLAVVITRDVTEHVRAEEALRASQQRYRTLFESIDEGFCILEMIFDERGEPVDYRFLEANAAFERHTGLENAMGKSVRELVPRLDESWFRLYGNVATTGNAIRFENHAPAMNRWFEVYATRVGGPGSRQVALVFKDITARVEAEAAVLRNEERHRLVSLATNDVIWDWDLQTDRVEWNEMVQVHFGCTREELGPTIEDWYSRIHPEDRDRVVAGIHAAIDGGLESWSDEYRFRRKDGSYAAFLDRGHIGRDASGKAVRMIGSMLDLTERHRVEAALRESKERFEALADNISQLAWMADESGAITWYNQRWFDYTGTTFEEMQGWGWQTVHHPDHLQRVLERFKQHIATGEVWEDTFPLRSKTGEFRWFLSRARPIRDSAGQVRRWFGTNTDITAQRETEARLKEALRARDEFLSIASHELRTPLTAMKLQLHLAQRAIARGDRSIYEPEQVHRLVEQSNRQVVRLTRLVEDMLDIARIQTGRLAIEPVPVDAVELTREVLGRLSPHLIEAGTPARLEAPERLEARWDRFRIEQVVTNLLTNAMRYGAHKPVFLKLLSHDGRILLSVSDQGLGIAKEDQERIFNRFERAISASNVSGLGLGLFISRQIVEAHGGRIWVESEGPGQGATFFVELPAFPDFPPPRQAEAARGA